MTTSTTSYTIILLAIIHTAMCTISPDPRSYFPGIEGNLTKIVWAHAVNSQEELEKSLASGDIMMLEADVVLGKLNVTTNTTSQNIPIMAHPPANESDLSLEEFIKNIVEKNTTKGIKLDFKSIEAFEASKQILEKARNDLTFPVFLNADILPGPVNATNVPVNPTAFLTGATKSFPEYTLSVGWTTKYGAEHNISEGRYTTEQIQTMIDTLTTNKVTQPITYPVRAGLVANDISVIKTLMENSSSLNNVTLTIWHSEGDNVDTEELSKLIVDVGVDKVYVDLPGDVMKRLHLSGASSLAATLAISLGPMLVTLILAEIL